MNLSNNGIQLLKRLEGFRPKAYLDSGNRLTIGYGHLIQPDDGVPPGDIIDPVKGCELLKRDVAWAEAAVDREVLVDLNQDQFDALVIFVYNVGATAFKNSTMLKMINKGDMAGASEQFVRWNRAGGMEILGLLKRRKEEQALFLSTAISNTGIA